MNKTLAQARKVFWDALTSGEEVVCPCCDRHAKARRRSVYKGMALILLGLYRHRFEWTHVGKTLGYKGGDFAKLRYWTLIEEHPHDGADNGSNSSGLWRITQAGVDFVEGRVPLYKFIDVYNATPLRAYGETVTLQDVLGEGFDYREMMGQR